MGNTEVRLCELLGVTLKPPGADPGFSDPGLPHLLSQLKHSGIAVDQYKPGFLRRRIATRLQATGSRGYDHYARLLIQSPIELDELRRDLTINVTQFFRDPDVYTCLEAEILPLVILRAVQDRRRHA